MIAMACPAAMTDIYNFANKDDFFCVTKCGVGYS